MGVVGLFATAVWYSSIVATSLDGGGVTVTGAPKFENTMYVFWLMSWPSVVTVLGITIAVTSPLAEATYTVSVVCEAGTRSALRESALLDSVTV